MKYSSRVEKCTHLLSLIALVSDELRETALNKRRYLRRSTEYDFEPASIVDDLNCIIKELEQYRKRLVSAESDMMSHWIHPSYSDHSEDWASTSDD